LPAFFDGTLLRSKLCIRQLALVQQSGDAAAAITTERAAYRIWQYLL